jgi:hypothetical protein
MLLPSKSFNRGAILPGLSAESLGVQAEDAERLHLQGGLQLTIILICLIDSSESFCMMLTKAKSSTSQWTRVLRLRIKDKHAAALTAMACEVNFVWNYVNDLAFKVWLRERRFMSEYDIDAYTAGASSRRVKGRLEFALDHDSIDFKRTGHAPQAIQGGQAALARFRRRPPQSGLDPIQGVGAALPRRSSAFFQY